MSGAEDTTAASLTASHGLTPNGVVTVSNLQLASLIMCLVVVLFASHQLDLGVERKLGVAAVRCLIQLAALGLVLVPIIMYNYPPLILGYITLMMLISAVEASARPPYVFDAMVVVCFVSITATVALFGTFTFTVVLSTGLDAQYAIPIVGMITGQAMSAVSVSISNLVTEFAERKSNVEVLLALGASRWEACYDILRSSVILGLTPTLNTMSVTGLVSIPGMMTGQIIGGTPPGLAAKYQLVIMYVASARYLASKLLYWRGAVQQRASPFPAYVNDPIPMTHDPSTTIPIASDTDPVTHPKSGDDVRRYGSIFSSKNDEANL